MIAHDIAFQENIPMVQMVSFQLQTVTGFDFDFLTIVKQVL